MIIISTDADADTVCFRKQECISILGVNGLCEYLTGLWSVTVISFGTTIYNNKQHAGIPLILKWTAAKWNCKPQGLCQVLLIASSFLDSWNGINLQHMTQVNSILLILVQMFTIAL